MLGYIEDIFHMTKLVPRVANHLVNAAKPDSNYYDVICAHRELKSMKGWIDC